MEADFTLKIKEAMEYLHKQGAFLTAKYGDTVNTMTVSWGSIGYVWNKPIFTVYVRKERFTHSIIEKSKEFTISVPFGNSMKEALTICGTKSGRDTDKKKESKIEFIGGKTIDTPVVDNCNMYYECKVVYSQDMNPVNLDEYIKKNSYKAEDYHTIYYGEIVDIYAK